MTTSYPSAEAEANYLRRLVEREIALADFTRGLQLTDTRTTTIELTVSNPVAGMIIAALCRTSAFGREHYAEAGSGTALDLAESIRRQIEAGE